jgi:outer membrane murein-binding lipoprotein Lpp
VRYQQRLEYVEKQLKDTEQVLEKEKQRTKSLPVDIAEHEEIMKKVELLAEMEEMNKVLNTEKDTLQTKVKQTEAQVKYSSYCIVCTAKTVSKVLNTKKDTLQTKVKQTEAQVEYSSYCIVCTAKTVSKVLNTAKDTLQTKVKQTEAQWHTGRVRFILYSLCS